MSATPAQLETILDEFRELEDPEEYLEELVRYGQDLDELPPERRTPENKVPGCISNVHIEGRLEDGKMFYRASAESLLVRGMVAILVRGLSGLTPEEILGIDADVLKEAGLTRSLTPSRANASYNILQMMKQIAAAA